MWRLLTSDWRLKVLALVLAALIWFYANSVVTRTTDISVKFNVTRPDSVEVEIEPKDQMVKLTLRGPAAVISDLREENVRVQYNLVVPPKGEESSTRPIAFDARMVTGLPPQVQIVDFEPSGFLLKLHPLATATFPVGPPEPIGTPATGYRVGRARIQGDAEVSVTAPAEIIRRMKDNSIQMEPEPVDITDRASTVEDRFHPIRQTVQMDNTTYDVHCDDTVHVEVEILPEEKETEERKFRVPIYALKTPGTDYKVEINKGEPIEITLVGPKQSMSGLVPEKVPDMVRAYIDITRTEPKKTTSPEDVWVHGRDLPDGVKVKQQKYGPVDVQFILPKEDETPEPETALPEAPNP